MFPQNAVMRLIVTGEAFGWVSYHQAADHDPESAFPQRSINEVALHQTSSSSCIAGAAFDHGPGGKIPARVCGGGAGKKTLSLQEPVGRYRAAQHLPESRLGLEDDASRVVARARPYR